MLLEFKELNQRLTRLDNNFPVEKSQEYLYAKCDFSNEFDDLNIACYVNGIVFQANANGLYEIPYEQIAYPSFNIYFVGTLDTKVITTRLISISVLKTGDLSGVPPISTQPLLMDTWYNNFQFAIDSQTNEIVLSMITKNNVLTTKRITMTYDGTGTNYLGDKDNTQTAITELDTQVKASNDAIALRELLSNKAIDFSIVNDTKYPTTKAVSEMIVKLTNSRTQQSHIERSV